ncbi:MAG: group 1 glycosyl transferase [Sediminibacterium sp.]|nr:group 1 glycosyl transferase [Sediminibacterium sp.]
MNILILHGSSDLYGASKILLVTVDVLKKHGHHPTVVLTEQGPLAAILEQQGIEVIYIRLGILRRKYKSLKGLLNRLGVLRKAYLALKQLAKQKNIDLIYSNTTAVLAGAYTAKKLGIRHIWHVHEIIEKPFWMYRFIGGLLNRYSSAVIVVSEAVKKSWGRFVPGEKMHLLYNGIGYEPYLQPSDRLRTELSLGPDTIIIGMIGRVHWWKGQAYFLEIAGHLSRKFHQLRFVMIGDAFPGYEYLYQELAILKQEENIEGVVHDLGYRTDVAELLQGFDILVLPSTQPDPFPTVVLEAMAAAKPVVATAHGGALEMVDNGSTGILIPPDNAYEAALCMEKLVTGAQERQRMGEAGRKKVLAVYSLAAFENKLIKILE